jgi:hypothetical protein
MQRYRRTVLLCSARPWLFFFFDSLLQIRIGYQIKSGPRIFCLAPPNQYRKSNQIKIILNPNQKKENIKPNQMKSKRIQVSGGAWRAVPRRLRLCGPIENIFCPRTKKSFGSAQKTSTHYKRHMKT